MTTSGVPWYNPLAYASTLQRQGVEDLCLLHSSVRTSYSGRYSYLAWGVSECIEGNALELLAPLEHDGDTAFPHWFGTIAYEAAREMVQFPSTIPSVIPMPIVRFVRYTHVLRFDHDTQRAEYEGEGASAIPEIQIGEIHTAPRAQIHSMMPRDAYLTHVENALEQIRAGSFYQVNLTRKYAGEFERPLFCNDAVALFTRLCEVSPAPYSALIMHRGDVILSSSPELFMALDARGKLTTRPIKGTAPLGISPETLKGSIKDRAENLMIVDLMRNDLSRCAVAGSVRVPDLYDVDNFSTLRHLSSTITARALPELSVLEMLRATFPAGSMTGAPKCAAMDWIARHEGQDRGMYSGALGWIHGRTCEFSVVIRTLIARGSAFECQVGGGIITDSDPESEYAETLTKAKGLFAMLGL